MAIGAALVDEANDARRRLRGYRVRADKKKDKRERNGIVVRYRDMGNPFVRGVAGAYSGSCSSGASIDRDSRPGASSASAITTMTLTISGRFKRSGQVSRLRSSRRANPREPKLTILTPVEAVTKSRSLAALAASLAVVWCVRADAGQAPRKRARRSRSPSWARKWDSEFLTSASETRPAAYATCNRLWGHAARAGVRPLGQLVTVLSHAAR